MWSKDQAHGGGKAALGFGPQQQSSPRDPPSEARSTLETPLIPHHATIEDETIEVEHNASDFTAPKSSAFQTLTVLLSIFLGLGLLGQPFALRLGGWSAVFAQIVTIAFFYTSALLLSRALDHLPFGVSKTFPALGLAAIGGHNGRLGALVVAIAGVLECAGGLTIALLVALRQVEQILPLQGLSTMHRTMVAIIPIAVAIVPGIAQPLSRLAPLASAGSLSSAMVAMIVLALPVLDPRRMHVPKPLPGYSIFEWPGILQAVGVFAVSCSGHSTLASVRASMLHPERFEKVLGFTFAALTLCYVSTATCGYWYWGQKVDSVITVDLAAHSPFGHSVQHACEIAIFATCLAKIPLLIIVVQDIVDNTLPSRPGITSAAGRFMERLSVAAIAVLLAVLGRNTIGDILSLVGGLCSVTTSMLMPVFFYARLTWDLQSVSAKAGLLFFGAIAVALAIGVTGLNLADMATTT